MVTESTAVPRCAQPDLVYGLCLKCWQLQQDTWFALLFINMVFRVPVNCFGDLSFERRERLLAFRNYAATIPHGLPWRPARVSLGVLVQLKPLSSWIINERAKVVVGVRLYRQLFHLLICVIWWTYNMTLANRWRLSLHYANPTGLTSMPSVPIVILLNNCTLYCWHCCYCIVIRVTCVVDQDTAWRRATSARGMCWRRSGYAFTPHETRRTRRPNWSFLKLAKSWSVNQSINQSVSQSVIHYSLYGTVSQSVRRRALQLLHDVFAADLTVKI